MRTIVLMTGLAAISACTSPAARFMDDAAERGFAAESRQSAGQRLVVLRKGQPRPGQALHVYLDGDGKPLLSRHRVARDPSTRTRLVLDLMERDPAASALVGRPCYYLEDNPCDALMWTDQRYSEVVVQSVAATITELSDAAPDSPLTLIGYSGGGALAMLVAPRLARVSRVVTLAANLDVSAWAAHHGYSPLAGSLDPAEAPPLGSHIAQLHLFGGLDDNVPAALMRTVAERSPSAVFRVLPDYDHVCCWAEGWPGLLEQQPGPN